MNFVIYFIMNIFYPLIITSIAGFSTMLGNILLFIDPKYKNKIISFSLGLSFCVMFLVSVIELIPEGVYEIYKNFTLINVFVISLIFLLVGYFIVIIIEKKINNDDNLYKIGILSMISLLIHNIPEGIICAITSSNSIELGLKMSFIILVHNIPEGICISLPVYYSTESRGKAVFMTFISSLGELIGALITMLFLKNYITDLVLAMVLLITAGIMITLSIFKIYKEGISYKCYKWFIGGVLLGILIIGLTL